MRRERVHLDLSYLERRCWRRPSSPTWTEAPWAERRRPLRRRQSGQEEDEAKARPVNVTPGLQFMSRGEVVNLCYFDALLPW